VWLLGEEVFEQAFDENRVTVPYAGLRFILGRQSCADNDAPIDLTTALSLLRSDAAGLTV
jgi:hypothetical protein